METTIIKPKKKWKPKIGDTYNLVLISRDESTWMNDEQDKIFYRAGNCFKTPEEVKAKIKEIKKILKGVK